MNRFDTYDRRAFNEKVYKARDMDTKIEKFFDDAVCYAAKHCVGDNDVCVVTNLDYIKGMATMRQNWKNLRANPNATPRSVNINPKWFAAKKSGKNAVFLAYVNAYNSIIYYFRFGNKAPWVLDDQLNDWYAAVDAAQSKNNILSRISGLFKTKSK